MKRASQSITLACAGSSPWAVNGSLRLECMVVQLDQGSAILIADSYCRVRPSQIVKPGQGNRIKHPCRSMSYQLVRLEGA